MDEILTEFRNYARGAWRFRWYGLGVAWALALAGSAFVFSIPPQYDSQAQIYVDTHSLLRTLLKGLAVEPNMAQRVQLIARTLLTTPNLENVIHETDLGLRATTQDAREAQVEQLRHKIKVGVGGRDDIYTIDYTDYDPHMAQRVVQAVVDLLMQNSLGNTRMDSSVAQTFLERQRDDYAARLHDAEQRLANFKKAHIGMMPDQSGDYYQRLQTAMDNVRQTGADLVVARRRVQELKQQVSGEQPTFGIMPTNEQPSDSASASPIEQRIQADEAKLDNLLLQYTDKYPTVIALKAEIARLKQRAAKENAAQSKASSPAAAGISSIDQNPVYQNTQIQLNDAKADVAALEGKLSVQKQTVDQLKKMVDTIPEVEAQLAHLNRDYSVTKSQYQKLLTRLDTARLSQDVQQSGDKLKVKVIDPPALPLQPSAPNRPLFIIVAFLGSIGAGVGFAIFLHISRPVFMDRKTLGEITGLPVIGSVTLALTSIQHRRRQRQLVGFASSLVLLAFVFGAAIAFNEPVSHVVQSFLTRV